jgi:hypothetical protein
MGELLKEYDGRGGDRTKTEGAHGSAPTQRKAASDAGVSEHQQLQAVRVANVPDAAFDAAVEGDKPATVTALAVAADREPPRQAGPTSNRTIADGGSKSEVDFRFGRAQRRCCQS